jgi:ribosomal-protein-alanine N-acetyltransferase
MKAVSFRIRRALEPDIERIIEIERSWKHLSHWSLDAYYRLVEGDGFTSSLVAELDEADDGAGVVGFVIFHVADFVSEIYNIAVESRHARLGIGGSLMQHTMELSREKGARKLVLEVRKSNHTAIRFYDRFRFRISGQRRNYYSNPIEDAFVMERDLRY